MSECVLLLTACVHPNGMPLTALDDCDERRKQYIDALHFYIKQSLFPVVFVENSDTDLSASFKQEIKSGQLEMLTFDGNKDKSHGKGYGELEIVDYALQHSLFIQQSKRIIKVTGRLIITNIVAIQRCCRFGIYPNKAVVCTFHSDFSFADSRIIIAPLSFYKLLIGRKESINDVRDVYLEHIFADLLKNNDEYHYKPFIEEIVYQGYSGSTGELYVPVSRTELQHYSFFIHSLYQRIHFLQKYRTRSFSLIRLLYLTPLYLLNRMIYQLIRYIASNK